MRIRKPKEKKENIEWSDDDVIEVEKPRYKCGSCSHFFISNNGLLRHESRVHPKAPYRCDMCAQRFVSKKRVSDHIISVHSLKQPAKKIVIAKAYKCGACKKVISSKNGLHRHKRIVHENIYEFLCEHCSAPFRDSSGLTKHLQKYHNVQQVESVQVKCSCCSKLVQSSSFERHEEACRLKKQEIFNRELDKEWSFLESLETSVEFTAENIKKEPELIIEDEITFEQEHLEDELVDAGTTEEDPFEISQLIKQEDTIIISSDEEIENPGIKSNEPANDFHQHQIFIKEEPKEGGELTIANVSKVVKLVKKIVCKKCPMIFNTRAEVVHHFRREHIPKKIFLAMKIQSSRKTTIDDVLRQQLPGKLLKLRKTSQEETCPLVKLPSSIPNPSDGDFLRKRKFKCIKCDNAFDTNSNLEEHYDTDHLKIDKDKFHCVFCTHVFIENSQLQNHCQIAHRKRVEEVLDESEDEVNIGEPENVDENELSGLFKGKSYNLFAKVYDCKICELSFSKLGELKIHCVLDHHIKKYKCTKCNLSYGLKTKFRAHWLSNHSNKPFNVTSFFQRDCVRSMSNKCPICSSFLSGKDSLKRHIELVHNTNRPTLYCDQCAETFKDARTLKSHVQRLHSENLDEKVVVRRRKTTQAVKCEECGEIVYGKNGLLSHRWLKHYNIRIKDKHRYHCLICEQVMNCRNSALRHHRQVHHNGRLLLRTCHQCESKFKLFDDFKRHVDEDHGAEGKRICLICGQNSKTSIEFMQHTKTHRSVPESEKQLSCDLCGFKAQQKTTIESHMVKFHNGKKREYNATCEFCGASFTCYQSFHAHRKTHQAQEKNKLECSLCEKSYFNIRDLSNHELSHTNPEGKERFLSNFTTLRAFFLHRKTLSLRVRRMLT
jgi:Zinc finger, C2H2 type